MEGQPSPAPTKVDVGQDNLPSFWDSTYVYMGPVYLEVAPMYTQTVYGAGRDNPPHP